MKNTITIVILLFSVLTFGQTPMSIEKLPDLINARTAQIQICTSQNKFVVIGGHINGFNLTKNAEVYNSTTKTWESTAAVDNRDMSFVAKLNNGKYLIGGGCSSTLGVGQLATSEIYDPANNSFTAAASMNVARTNVCAATLADGRVLVVGNWYNSADNAEIYDPVANTYTLTGVCQPRAVPVVVPTNDGGAIVCGTVGIYGSAIGSFSFEKFDPVTNSFSIIATSIFDGETLLNIATNQPVLTQQYLLPNGKYAVLVYKSDYSSVRIITINPANSKIEELVTQKPISISDDDDQTIKYSCGRTLMIDRPHNLLHIIQQASINNQITLRIVTINLLTGSVNSSKMDGFDYSVSTSNLTMLDDGRILFTGGNKFDNFTLSSKAFIITPATYPEVTESSPMTIDNLPDLNMARAAQIQICGSQNKYVIVGGHVNGFDLTKNAEVYNATTKAWETTTAVDNRDMGYVAKLKNGKYLIGGGCSYSLGVGQLATSEIYDPAANTFTASANMNVARTNVCAATLTDGRVLVVGNWYNSADNAEVYDPATNTFTLTGSCIVARALPVIIPTNDGGAVVCGGVGIYGSTHNDFVFEKYDPVSNSFSVLTRTLFEGETSWNIMTGQPTLTQQYLMPDGKYAVLVYTNDYSLARLISIDPATNEIKEIKTQKAISLVDETDPNITYGCSRTLLIDQSRKLIHIVQQGGTTSNIILRIVTVNLQTGSVNTAKKDGFDYSVSTSNLTMLDDGRILFTGGNKFDNFTLSPKAFIVTPAKYQETSLRELKLQCVNARWSAQDQSFVFDRQITNATLYSVSGRVLGSVNNSNRLKTTTLASGIYIIRVKPTNDTATVGLKVIKP